MGKKNINPDALEDMYEALKNVVILIEEQFPNLMKSYNYGLIKLALTKAESSALTCPTCSGELQQEYYCLGCGSTFFGLEAK